MKVKLISYTKPDRQLYDEGLYDAQDLVAFCARVSNPANQFNTATSEKLIRYLVDNGHWSPLEMVNLCLEVTTTRDIARQLLRHRSFTFQEFSQRYADPTKDLDFVCREARLQDTKNRQNSLDTDDRELKRIWLEKQQNIIREARSAYEWAVSCGIAKEQARAVLPEGLTVSKLYMQGTLRSWVHYIQLRSAHGTQKEHIEIARACSEVISKVFPLVQEFTQ